MTCMARDVREQFAYRSRKSGLRCLRHLQLIRVSGFGVQMILIDSRSFPAETLKGLEFETSRPAYLCLHIPEPACSVGRVTILAQAKLTCSPHLHVHAHLLIYRYITGSGWSAPNDLKTHPHREDAFVKKKQA